MSFFIHLLTRHLRQYPGRAAAAILVLFIASTLMLALAGAGTALKFRVGAYLAKLFPEERLQLESARGGFGPLAVEIKPITDDTLRQISRQPDIAEIWPVEPVRFPIRVEGNLFGNEISSDAVIHGVARELVADALPSSQGWRIPLDPLRGEYPIVVSNYFLDLYNLGLARASGLPLLNPQAVIGRHVTLVLGESTVGLGHAAQPSREVRAVVVGITRQPAMLGLALPAEVVRQFNVEFAPTQSAQYVQLVVRLKPGADRENFLENVQPLGLTLGGGERLAGQVKRAVWLGGWGLLGLATAVFALGLLTFYLLFAMLFHSRRLDLIRLRALGATPGYVVSLALGEVSVQALLAIGLASAANVFALRCVMLRITPWLAQFSWLPPELLRPNLIGLLSFSVAILAFTILPALGMLLEVWRVPPARVIRDL